MSVILLAFSGKKTSEKIRSVLLRSGWTDVRIVSGGGEALREMGKQSSGILICPVRMRDMDYHEVLRSLPDFYQILLIDSAQNVSGRREENVMALTLPVAVRDITSTVGMMLADIDHAWVRERKRRRNIPRKRSPEEQKVLDEAKHFLMDRNHMTEPEAFRYIQKNSMDTGRTMQETAEMILTFF